MRMIQEIIMEQLKLGSAAIAGLKEDVKANADTLREHDFYEELAKAEVLVDKAIELIAPFRTGV